MAVFSRVRTIVRASCSCFKRYDCWKCPNYSEYRYKEAGSVAHREWFFTIWQLLVVTATKIQGFGDCQLPPLPPRLPAHGHLCPNATEYSYIRRLK